MEELTAIALNKHHQYREDPEAIIEDVSLNLKDENEKEEDEDHGKVNVDEIYHGGGYDNILSECKNINDSSCHNFPTGDDSELINVDCEAEMDELLQSHEIRQVDTQRPKRMQISPPAATNENEEAQQFDEHSRCLENEGIPHSIACSIQMNELFTSTLDCSERPNIADELNDLEYSIDSDAVHSRYLSAHTINIEGDFHNTTTSEGNPKNSPTLVNVDKAQVHITSNDGIIQFSACQNCQPFDAMDKNEADESDKYLENFEEETDELCHGRKNDANLSKTCPSSHNETSGIFWKKNTSNKSLDNKIMQKLPNIDEKRLYITGDLQKTNSHLQLNELESFDSHLLDKVFRDQSIPSKFEEGQIVVDGISAVEQGMIKEDSTIVSFNSSVIESTALSVEDAYQAFSLTSGSPHKASWKSTGTPGVLKKMKRREDMLEKFQSLLVKVKSPQTELESSVVDNSTIKNSDDVSSNTSLTFSYNNLNGTIPQDNNETQVKHDSTDNPSQTGNVSNKILQSGIEAQSRNDVTDHTSRSCSRVEYRDKNARIDSISHQKQSNLLKITPDPWPHANEVSSDLPKKKTDNHRSMPHQKQPYLLKINPDPWAHANMVSSNIPKKKIDNYRSALQKWKARQDKRARDSKQG